MFKWLKKYLVSHKDNDYVPHLFREAGLVSLFLVIVILFAVSTSSRVILTRADLIALVLPGVLVDYANQDRDISKYGHLAINTTLQEAAQLKANDMAEKGYFAHKTPEGHSPWYWFAKVGYSFSYAGENLAVNFTDSVDVNTAWMNSPGHKANIMNENFTEIGIATAEGMYQGRRTTFVVQLFGRPAKKTLATNTKVATTTKTVSPKTVATPIATSSVLSESTSVETPNSNGTNELFVAVENTSAVAGASPTSKYSSFFDRAITSPKKVLSFSYLIISIIIMFSLLSMLFIEIKREHNKMILLALSMLIIMSGLLYVFQSVLFNPLFIA